MYVGRRLTREEKRRIQRWGAIVGGIATIVILVAFGFAAGMLA